MGHIKKWKKNRHLHLKWIYHVKIRCSPVPGNVFCIFDQSLPVLYDILKLDSIGVISNLLSV